MLLCCDIQTHSCGKCLRTNSVVYEVEYEMKEVIPVAIVTARRLPHVLRQVGQVWASPGGTNTPITIFVDGHNPEAQALAALLHLPLVQHYAAVPRGSTNRISYHVRFVLTKVFELYPEVDKAIILEDDLDLSPDFIPYFHQTAQLLTLDPKLLCVSAYYSNAFNHTALDPTRLYRVHGAPAYGWMVRRKVANEMINNWVPMNKSADWDLWVRISVMGDRDILVPEIPRTKHRGGGGVHVTGIEQEQYYNQRPLNALLNVTLDLHGAELDNYLKLHTSNIRTGHVVHFSKHPCVELPIPRHQMNQSYVVYVNTPLGVGFYAAYVVVAKCLGLDDHNFIDNLKMMSTTSFYGNQLYVIGCPTSPFCMTTRAEHIYSVTLKDIDYAISHPFRKITMIGHEAVRKPTISLSEELILKSRAHYYFE
nr:protein O-linked-mannose beta-1,2-N-acetylglucosaminyltransferase 1-like [Procambarus clarkii]